MRFSSALFAATIVLPVFAAPTLVPITKRGGTLKENSYIITLKDGESQANFLEALKKSWTHSDSAVIHSYSVINGFSMAIAPSDMPVVRSMPGIASIEQDQMISLPDHEVQDLPPVGGGGQPAPSTGDTTHNGGEGVTIYGLDTGINVDHECFGGRARWGWAAPPMVHIDDQGHGTHTAGTAIGKGFGVATKAEMVAVKVMNAAGTGSTSDIVKGIDYSCNTFKQSGKPPSIVTMSLGGGINEALDQAVRNCIGWGMHFTIAAGNDNKDAKDVSPARVEQAITVGAVDKNNVKASFSNYGPIVDIQAPGVGIVSAGHVGTNSEKTASGTSMATPYVAGVLAVALGEHGEMSSAELSSALRANAKDVCTGMPDGTTKLLATIW
ncbi:serine protease [Rhizoctonia solani]|nr:serine protease [Rhizoctonia solani]